MELPSPQTMTASSGHRTNRSVQKKRTGTRDCKSLFLFMCLGSGVCEDRRHGRVSMFGSSSRVHECSTSTVESLVTWPRSVSYHDHSTIDAHGCSRVSGKQVIEVIIYREDLDFRQAALVLRHSCRHELVKRTTCCLVRDDDPFSSGKTMWSCSLLGQSSVAKGALGFHGEVFTRHNTTWVVDDARRNEKEDTTMTFFSKF